MTDDRAKIGISLTTLASLVAGPAAYAQDAPDGRWHYLVQPYVMFPNMKGETGIRNLPPVHIDESPSDIFENLQMGAMFYAEAQNDHWTFSTDTLYMNLGADMSTNEPGLIEDVDVDVSQLGWELAVMRRLTPQYELGLGLTYNQIDVDVAHLAERLGGRSGLDQLEFAIMHELINQGFPQVGVVVDKENPASDHGSYPRKKRAGV